MIIKSFIKKGSGFFGQDIESWTKASNEVKDILDFSIQAEKGHLSSFFKMYFPYPPKKILDGGCGVGAHVIAYRKLGYDIIGVDFSNDIIRRIKKEVSEDVPVYAADLTALPFNDSYFDCCLLAGVIEHFEEGPYAVLKEIRRVLKKDGLLLVAVPYINILRWIYFSIFPIKKKSNFLQKRCNSCQLETDVPSGYNFCEYFFDVHSLIPYFSANNFLLQEAFPVDFLWGEIGLIFKKAIERYSARKVHENRIGSIKRSFTKRLIYDFLITENRNNLFFRFPLALLNHLSGHMVLLIAKPASLHL